MISLLNTITWCIALMFATIPMMIDLDYSILSVIIFFAVKGILFPRKKIIEAVNEWVHKEKDMGARVGYFSDSSSVNTESESLMVEKSSERIPVSIAATTDDDTMAPLILEEPIEVKDEPSRLRLWIGNFFSERPLAKVGGIFLFLGVLFFLYLIFDWIGPVGKICIGLLFGFSLIGTGLYLDKKEIIVESRVLFGIGIAVDFLTILSGRHLLSTTLGSGIPLFSDTVTTIFILLNTALAVILSLVYRSRVLLGFAFIFAYLTPFLIGSHSSSAILLTIYTTILTIAIAVINNLYAKQSVTENVSYLQGIGTIGMTVLLSIVSLDANIRELIVLFIGLALSTCALAIYSYRAKLSPLPVCIGAYIVLFISTLAGSSFMVIPFGIIGLLLMIVYFSLQSILSLTFLTLFGGLSFILGLLGFWIDGGASIYLLLMTGASIFCILSIVIFRTASILLGSISIIGFGVLILLGMSTVSIGIDAIDMTEIILTKCMSIFLLIGAGIFTLRLRNGFLFFLAIVLSGMLMIYPDTFERAFSYSTIAITLYLIISLILPYIMTRDSRPIMYPSFLLGSLPISALIVSYGLYEVGVVRFPGMILGLAYILLAVIYLIYAMITGSRYFPHGSTPLRGDESIDTTNNTLLLILFALPLSLFTLALAFVFGDTPGIMSLAWIMESSILYLVSVRMREVRIFMAASLVFFIGILKQIDVMLHIIQSDWFMFGVLILTVMAVFSSLIILAKGDQKNRLLYDILHIVSICIIGYSIGEIIPSTGTGWSILGPSVFLLIITPVYRLFGKRIQKIFLAILLGGLCLVFIGKFDSLLKGVGPLIVQSVALVSILSIGYLGYRSREYTGYIYLVISVLGGLIISSLYVDYFFATFAVSIYLTIIASILIIRGISNSNTILRTIGLYIGTFALLKILGYDIWKGSYGTIVRVVALMMAGGIMIYLSQLYGKYVTRSWSEEFSLTHIFTSMGGVSTNEGDTGSDIPDDRGSLHPFSQELEHEIESTPIDHLSSVRFIPNTGDIFMIKHPAIIRLALHITNTLGKKIFLPHELDSTYLYVMKNLESTLPKKDLDTLLMKLKVWIEQGGSIDFTEKK